MLYYSPVHHFITHPVPTVNITLAVNQSARIKPATHFTFILEPFEERLCSLNQTPETQPMSQVGTQQPEGLVLRRLVEVFAALLQPQADDREQRAGGPRNEGQLSR